MIAKRLSERTDQVRAQPIRGASVKAQTAVHPITNHESFSHSVMFTQAHAFREKTAGLLHGRTHTDPTKRPHEQKSAGLFHHLERGQDLRPGMGGKNV
jgi:hypothetical protein